MSRHARLADWLPLRDAYAGLHAWMIEHGVPCISPAVQARESAEIRAAVKRAREFDSSQ